MTDYYPYNYLPEATCNLLFVSRLTAEAKRTVLKLADKVRFPRFRTERIELGCESSCIAFALLILKRLHRNLDLTAFMFEFHIKKCKERCPLDLTDDGHLSLYDEISDIIQNLVAQNLLVAKAQQYDKAMEELKEIDAMLVADPSGDFCRSSITVAQLHGELIRPIPIPIAKAKEMRVTRLPLRVDHVLTEPVDRFVNVEVIKEVPVEVEKIVFVNNIVYREVVKGIYRIF